MGNNKTLILCDFSNWLYYTIYGAVSDMIDGYLARKLDAYSKMGQYLDAISDKLYFLSLIIILLVNKKYLIILPMIMELIISIINYLMLKKNKKVFIDDQRKDV